MIEPPSGPERYWTNLHDEGDGTLRPRTQKEHTALYRCAGPCMANSGDYEDVRCPNCDGVGGRPRSSQRKEEEVFDTTMSGYWRHVRAWWLGIPYVVLHQTEVVGFTSEAEVTPEFPPQS